MSASTILQPEDRWGSRQFWSSAVRGTRTITSSGRARTPSPWACSCLATIRVTHSSDSRGRRGPIGRRRFSAGRLPYRDPGGRADGLELCAVRTVELGDLTPLLGGRIEV